MRRHEPTSRQQNGCARPTGSIPTFQTRIGRRETTRPAATATWISIVAGTLTGSIPT